MNKVMGALVVVLLGTTGCMGHAELVKRDQTGGVLALKGNRDKAMADAQAQMGANCPSGYDIVGEEMAKVGEATEAQEDTAFEKKGASKSTSSVTSDVKEYRITYKCKSG